MLLLLSKPQLTQGMLHVVKLSTLAQAEQQTLAELAQLVQRFCTATFNHYA